MELWGVWGSGAHSPGVAAIPSTYGFLTPKASAESTLKPTATKDVVEVMVAIGVRIDDTSLHVFECK